MEHKMKGLEEEDRSSNRGSATPSYETPGCSSLSLSLPAQG